LFEIDYLPLVFNQEKEVKGLGTRCLGFIPSRLTTENVKELIRPTYKWMKLDKNDYFLPEEGNILEEYYFSPTSMETWIPKKQHPVNPSNELLGRGLVCLKGKIRRFASVHVKFGTIPLFYREELEKDSIDSCVVLVRINSSTAGNSNGGGSGLKAAEETQQLESVFLSCVDAVFVSNANSSSGFSSLTTLFVGLEKSRQSLKIFEYDNQKKLICCNRVVGLTGLTVSKLWFSGTFLYFLVTDSGI
jgi:hypothetical protein